MVLKVVIMVIIVGVIVYKRVESQTRKQIQAIEAVLNEEGYTIADIYN